MKPLFTSSGGVKYQWDDSTWDQGFARVVSSQDVAPILDHNKAQANENGGWMAGKWGRRCATIPHVVRQKIINEEGVDVLHPDNFDRLKRLLNDPDYLWLRTANWRV